MVIDARNKLALALGRVLRMHALTCTNSDSRIYLLIRPRDV